MCEIALKQTNGNKANDRKIDLIYSNVFESREVGVATW